MAKECKIDGCSWPVFSKLLCQNHWKQQYGKPIYKNPSLKQTSQQPAKPFHAISKVSAAQLKRLERYRIEREIHFKEYPVCQFPNCTSTDITLHHGKSRIGDLLFDRRFFKSLCFPHHRWAEENPEEAYEIGISFKRLEK